MRNTLTGEIVDIDPIEFTAFAGHQARLLRIAWGCLVGGAVAVGLMITLLVSFVLAIAVVVAITLLGYEWQKRWNCARWLKRFPQLDRSEITWRARSSS